MSASAFFTLLRTYASFYLHTRRFQAIFALYLIADILVPLLSLTNVLPRPANIYDYANIAMSNFAFTAMLPASLMAGDAISQDFSRQGYFTLTQPVRRSEIMAARFLSAFAISLLTMLVWLGGGMSGAYALYGTVLPNTPAIVMLLVLFVASATSFVVLFSSIFRSPMVSLIVSVVVVLLLMPIASGILELLGVEPWPLITYAGSVVGALAASSYPPHFQPLPGNPSPLVPVALFTPFVWEAAAIMAAYLLISLGLAWLIYSRKEIKEVS